MKVFMLSLLKYTIPLYLFLVSGLTGYSQVDVDNHSILEGLWMGNITQKEGGYRANYEIILDIKKKEGSFTAKTLISVDEIYVIMESSVELMNDVFVRMKDEKIINEKSIDGLNWCFKDFQLIIKQNGQKMEGMWQGRTEIAPCIPGKVFLKKYVPDA